MFSHKCSPNWVGSRRVYAKPRPSSSVSSVPTSMMTLMMSASSCSSIAGLTPRRSKPSSASSPYSSWAPKSQHASLKYANLNTNLLGPFGDTRMVFDSQDMPSRELGRFEGRETTKNSIEVRKMKIGHEKFVFPLLNTYKKQWTRNLDANGFGLWALLSWITWWRNIYSFSNSLCYLDECGDMVDNSKKLYLELEMFTVRSSADGLCIWVEEYLFPRDCRYLLAESGKVKVQLFISLKILMIWQHRSALVSLSLCSFSRLIQDCTWIM